MTEPETKNVNTAVPPMAVAIIGTGDGTTPTTGTIATTPGAHANLVVTVITPLMAIAVRFVNLFLTQLVGLLVAAMTPVGGHLLYTSDFWHSVVLCASLAFPGAALGLLKDCLTIFTRIEQKYPLASGSI